NLERLPEAELVGIVARHHRGHVDGTAAGQRQYLVTLAERVRVRDLDVDPAVRTLLHRLREILLRLQEPAVGEAWAPAKRELRCGLDRGGDRQTGEDHRRLDEHAHWLLHHVLYVPLGRSCCSRLPVIVDRCAVPSSQDSVRWCEAASARHDTARSMS